MTPIPAVHAQLEGNTASFRLPLFISAKASCPVPPYSTLLGLISACAGRIVRPPDTRIGFEFRCKARSVELETTKRFQTDNKNCLRPHPKGDALTRKEVLWLPRLDLYVTDPALIAAFRSPTNMPHLGHSDNLAWINFARTITLNPQERGTIGPTLVPMSQQQAPRLYGLPVRLPESFDNDKQDFQRTPRSYTLFCAMDSQSTGRVEFEGENLYHPSDAAEANEVIYLHQWQT